VAGSDVIADRGDVAATLEQRHTRKQAEMMPLIKLVAGAAPVMAKLVVDENWGRYQAYLQGLVEQWKKQRDAAKDKLGMVLEGEELRKLNADVLQANASIAAWELAIQLPAAIVQGSEEARKIIAEFEKRHENTSGQPKP
jgi:hypothetical protein